MTEQKLPAIAKKGSCVVTVEEGNNYFWCSCGLSTKQPFCDGSHKGTGFAPVKYIAEKTGNVAFCGCKHTKNGVLCDGAHRNIQ